MQNVLDLSLDELAGGALRERFVTALRDVLANIDDPNTDRKPRKIVATITLEPNKDRSAIGIGVVVDTKPRPREEIQTQLFVEPHGPNNFRVGEWNPKQLRLDQDAAMPLTTKTPDGAVSTITRFPKEA